MTVREALAAAADLLRKSCIDEPLREARLLLSLQPRFTLTYQLGHPNEALSREEVRLFDVQTTRRAAGEPFAYIAGSVTFFGRSFAVGPGVLIPRPETEQLTKWWLDTVLAERDRFSPAVSIVDLCTGSGVIGLTAALELARQGIRTASLYLSDISPDALAYAEQNRHALAPGLPVTILRSDLFFEPWPEADLVFCNPPYIDIANDEALSPDVSRYEPAAALDGGPDGLSFYRRLAAGLVMRVAPHTLIGVEHGYRQAAAVRQIFTDAGFDAEAVMSDYGGCERGQRFRLNRSDKGN